MPAKVFSNTATKQGFSLKLWRGERMALIGMDVDEPEDDLVGFAIEVKNPASKQFQPLRNRLNFGYGQASGKAVDGNKIFPSLEAPFQKFRWIHFPYDPKGGTYTYRVTKIHMPSDGKLVSGTSIALGVALDAFTYDNYLDVGFTRSFASSQAYADKYANNPKVIPAQASQGLKFHKLSGDVYEWLGFEAYQLIFDLLNEAVSDKSITIDFFAYDLNEPDIVALLEKLGSRLRAVIDNSGSHAPATSAESQAAKRFSASAGANAVKRMHFHNLQHNKVLIAKRDGKPFKVLFGSTNFSFRGIYIQANNVLVFQSPDAAGLFETAFNLAFTDPASFATNPIATKWHLLPPNGRPPVHFCFSPHTSANLSLNPLAAAINQATSSVFFAIAFLNQTHGQTRDAINQLMNKSVFSYGISDHAKGLKVKKPDGSTALVDFEFLSKFAPEPFKSEWSGGAGIHEHNKFVVTDFSLPTAKVFTGSSNLSPSGEQGNGDNLVMIEDPRVAASYAINALRIFDHLHFRTVMKASKRSAAPLTLAKPEAISGKPAWFADAYKDGSQAERDRKLFSH